MSCIVILMSFTAISPSIGYGQAQLQLLELAVEHLEQAVAKAAVMQVMQCMTKNFPKNV